MNFGRISAGLIAAAMAVLPGMALAQDAATEEVSGAPAADAAQAGADAAGEATAAADAYTPMGPDMIIGQPENGGFDVQEQFSEIGQYAFGLHVGLVWVMAVISLFVLALLVYVVIRFRKSANPVPSKTTHNTMIEVAWTLVPVLILVAIAIPSISLLAKQYESAPDDAVTVKVTGYQWNWGYEFPDQGVSEFISNMMPEDEAIAAGYPAQLEADQRLVVPVDTPLRIQVTAADVIHSWAVPALWFKLDAIPGRLNEKMLRIKEPGIYYGQCSELCGVRHAFMPIAVEAVPREQWEAWIVSRGGSLGGDESAEDNPATPVNEEAADSEAAETQPTEGDGEANATEGAVPATPAVQ